jgi:hypothetical protein
MRKHHNKLFFGKYSYKAIFKIPGTNMLYPTTQAHLSTIIKLTEGNKKANQNLSKISKFILAHRDEIKFRIQHLNSIFYGPKELILKLIDQFWQYWVGVTTTDPNNTDMLDQDTVLCSRLPLGKYQYQVHVQKKMPYNITKQQKELLNQYLTQNKDNAIVTTKNLGQWLSGKGAIHYDFNGYFYVIDQKALTPIYMISNHIIDRVVQFRKV